jgi:hypothetical protein
MVIWAFALLPGFNDVAINLQISPEPSPTTASLATKKKDLPYDI